MSNVLEFGDFSLRGRYIPKARYHALGDFVEYVREDKPYVMRRIDDFLTIALDLDTRQPQGFRLKGFKNILAKQLEHRSHLLDDQFLALVSLIEIAATSAGDAVFGNADDLKRAYSSAYVIASDDRVRIEPSAIAA